MIGFFVVFILVLNLNKCFIFLDVSKKQLDDGVLCFFSNNIIKIADETL